MSALNNATLKLKLFDDVQPTLTRRKVERPGADKLVWHGTDDFGTQAVFAVSKGVLTGTVYSDTGVFEIGLEPDGPRIPALVRALVGAGAGVEAVEREEASLEQVYLRMMKGGRP